MSATANDNATEAAINNQEQQFGSRVPRSEPLTQKGVSVLQFNVKPEGHRHLSLALSLPSTSTYTLQHKPGVLASEKDAAPEFTAQILPPGTAPKENTFLPQPNDEVPPSTNYATDSGAVDPDSTTVNASDTISGATSADVSTGLGHPGQGQTSSEIRHDGAHGRKKQTHGLEGTGAGGGKHRVPGMVGQGKGINERDPEFAEQRGMERDEVPLGGRMNEQVGGVGGPPAEERIPESAETVAREAPRD